MRYLPPTLCVLLSLACCGVPQQAPPAPPATPPPLITSGSLHAAYQQNSINADANFKGKQVRVSGVVHSVGTDEKNNPYILFKSEGLNITSVQCFFTSRDALLNVPQGQEVTVQGTCLGKFKNVMLGNCQIAN